MYGQLMMYNVLSMMISEVNFHDFVTSSHVSILMIQICVFGYFGGKCQKLNVCYSDFNFKMPSKPAQEFCISLK